MPIKLKRIYEKPHTDDGKRILIDRLWPRGITKQEAHIDSWLKEVAPSNQLRQWFNHDATKWDEFKQRYVDELNTHPESLHKLQSFVSNNDPVTLVFAAKDEQHNNAVVLQELLDKALEKAE